MARGPFSTRSVESYIVPILLTVALITCSQLLNLIEVRYYLPAAALVAALLAGTFGMQFLAARLSRATDRQDLFNLVSRLVMTNGINSPATLSESEVCAIESAASEVWIYAYDLAWEADTSPFARIVRENVARGVKYRYLVPEDRAVINRVNHIRKAVGRLRNGGSLVKFRCSQRERLITQFGLVIYNPSFQHREDGGEAASHETIAVFFPHYRDVSDEANRHDAIFLAIRGAATLKIQEAFYQYWIEAKEIARDSTKI
ncbi:MAG TPA: hypothetical protein VGX25_30970 [Actinophytocola sp.]|uniref:hypothetical protein n=1 Tax=Actinophytocola sp. TaxID=1872138 RepID=UPI002DDD3CFA|nr:hypothetical protein [Actinophytocola sp.]HEV2783832.1 hypothetical protein [Actinophytocola sp.]